MPKSGKKRKDKAEVPSQPPVVRCVNTRASSSAIGPKHYCPCKYVGVVRPRFDGQFDAAWVLVCAGPALRLDRNEGPGSGGA